MSYDLVDDFIDFVQTMPRDEEIDHSHGENENPWCNCAVGEFFRVRKGIDLNDSMLGDGILTEDDLEYALKERGLGFTHEVLNDHAPRTFGQLVEIIAAEQEGLFYDWHEEDEFNREHVVCYLEDAGIDFS